MTAEPKVKARQGVSGCSGRKWGFFFLLGRRVMYQERFGGEVTLML